MTLSLRVVHTDDLEPAELDAAHRLLLDVFDDLEPEDWRHCLGGLHALTLDGVVHTPDEEDCLFTWGEELDPSLPLTCGHREGELW